MPRKPKRRSSLSSQVMLAQTNATIPHLNPLPFGKGEAESHSTEMASVTTFPLLLDRGENKGEESQPPRILRNIALSLVSLVTEAAPRKTPLYDEHMRLGAKMVPFAGWLMPVQYTSIMEEHQAVRSSVGVFDISHMGQFIVDGAGGRDWLNSMLTNNVDKLDVGMGQYTLLLNDRGGIIDDLIVYRIDVQKYLLVVNAARADEDFAWLQNHLKSRQVGTDRPSGGLETTAPCTLVSRSADFGAVAIQ